jgi:hypothetical protein
MIVRFLIENAKMVMGANMDGRIIFAGVGFLLFSCSPGFADARFTYMLPRTVLDTTIVYTFKSCKNTPTGAQLNISIAPTIVARAIPDLYVGPKEIDPAQLQAWTQDRNITIKTYPTSHILQMLASQPTSQIGTIISNVLGGVSKLVAVGLGVAAADINPAALSKCGGTQDIVDAITKAQDQIRSLQLALANTPPPDEATQKADQALIQALQNQITNLQADLAKTTITVKHTIDPAFTQVKLSDKKPDATTPFPIDKDGLIATFDLPSDQVTAAKWYEKLDDVTQQDWKNLEVNLYLDFPHSFPYPVLIGANSQYHQTRVRSGPTEMYREAAYVPLQFWRGVKPARPPTDENGPVELGSPLTVVLAQYGIVQSLPTTAQVFQSISWSVSFLENGEVTETDFSSKSILAGATGAFSTVASTANSVAGEVRSAASAATSETVRLTAENNALSQEINNINLNQQLKGLIAKGLPPQ